MADLAIARHRIAAFNAGLERAAGIADLYCDKWGNANGFERHTAAARIMSAAIRAAKGMKP